MHELKEEANIWFILFMTFTSISAITVACLVYLISTMRNFVSLRKCLVTSMESRESRPSPQPLQPPLSTRPIIPNWANPGSPQQTPQPSTGPSQTLSQPQTDSPVQPHPQVQCPTQPARYPTASTPSPTQLSNGTGDTQVKVVKRETETDASIIAARMSVELEERYREYQRSLWELQRSTIPARTPGTPPGLYPKLELTASPSSGGGALG